MSRFVLGFLVGALAMHLYGIHGDTLVRDVVDWFEGTAADYGPSPRGAGSTEGHAFR